MISSTVYFILIIAVIIIGFVMERVLEYLNSTTMGLALPDKINDIYDSEKYSRQQLYQKANTRFSAITSFFSFFLIVGMIIFNGFAFLDGYIRQFYSDEIVVALLFFGLLFIALDILTLPFTVYSTFVIEEKFGFNKTTIKTFILDKIKSLGLTVLLGGGILAAVIAIYLKFPVYFWLIAWGIVSLFSLFFSAFYSNLIVPLFNKQKPLEPGELRDAIEEFAKRAGFKLKNIYVIDGSKRSTKANAYFTGIGSTKRIVLYDTLIKELEISEIVAVLAHEIGHYKKRHMIKGIITSLVQMGFVFYILSVFLSDAELSHAMGVTVPSFHIGLIAFGIIFTPVSTIVGIASNYISRKHEFEADEFASKHGCGMHLISGLKKLSASYLSNLTPHPIYVFFYYSHPPLLQRILHIEKFKI